LKKDHAYRPKGLVSDFLLIIASIIIALVLVQSGFLHKFLATSSETAILGSVIAGIFFTSIFTIAIATAALAELSSANNPLMIAFFGALGALLGDSLIFYFFRDRLFKHLRSNEPGQKGRKTRTITARLRLWIKTHTWFCLFVGGIVIASPIPDEFGISFLGFSKTKTIKFSALIFCLKFFGILSIALAIRMF
jgi:hypothetical protein